MEAQKQRFYERQKKILEGDKFVSLDEMEPELRPEYIAKMRRIEKEGHFKIVSVKELFKGI